MKTLKELKKERNKLGIELYTDLSIDKKLGPLIIYNLIFFAIIALLSNIFCIFIKFEYKRVFSFIILLFLFYELFTLYSIQVALGLVQIKGLSELFKNDYYYMMKFNNKIYGIKDVKENQKLILHELDFDIDCPFNFEEKIIYETTEVFSKKENG